MTQNSSVGIDALVIATRKSELAMWQANFIAAELRRVHPGLAVTLLPMSTKGDEILDKSLAKIGGKGLFIKELETALLAGTAHIAVHSMKDVPAQMPDGFALPVIGYRADPSDALVCRDAGQLKELPRGARVGSSSLRRQSQLLARRPDLQLQPVRGNVGTRLKLLEDGTVDALLLASAGLERLGLERRITARLPIADSVPAVGQGALGVECVAEDQRVLELLAPLNSPADSLCVAAERALSFALGASCSTPLGGYATLAADGVTLSLQAVLGVPDGSRLLRAQSQGEDPELVGAEAARELLDQGAGAILEQLQDMS